MKSFIRLVPGIALCCAVTFIAIVLERIEVSIVHQPYLEALVLAIILGVIIRSTWRPGPIWTAGIKFSAHSLLELAVVLLGASISTATVVSLGPLLLVGISMIVFVAIGASYGICRIVGLPKKMSLLIACGNSICGNSAIAAVAPVINADSDDVAASIAFTAVLGVAVVLLLPLLVPALALSLTQYGVLAGLTVYAVPQVLAATLPIGALSNQIGTVVKLVRVLLLGPVVLAISLLTSTRLFETREERQREQPNLKLLQMVPWFILGFLVVAGLRSFEIIPTALLGPIVGTASALTTVSMAALGLGVDIRTVTQVGARVVIAVMASLIILVLMSLGLIWATGTP